MQTWEYLTVLLEADTKKQRDNLPNARDLKYYDPTALQPQLNQFGAQGWELVTLHPYALGDNLDVLTHQSMVRFTHTYLCTFKRPLSISA